MNFWDNWAKPWNRDQCRDRYVRGPEISYSKLAQLSEVPLGTINRWRKGDSGKTWKTQRVELIALERYQTDQKTVKNRSDSMASLQSQHAQAQAEMIEELSVTLKELSLSHFNAYAKLQSVGLFMLDQYYSMVSDLTVEPPMDGLHPEQLEELKRKRMEFQMNPEKFFKGINLSALGAIASILDISVRGQREATGMKYLDINEAVRLVKSVGLEVTLPKNKELVKVPLT